MKIGLIGYGKMGKAIAEEASLQGDEVVYIFEKGDVLDVDILRQSGAQVLIEFTHPDAVLQNLQTFLPLGIPLVCGTTGWNAQLETVSEWVKSSNNALVYGSNYSIGVNILFKLNRELAKWMNPYPQYDVFLEEQHHRNKADAPSGTALSLAKDILQNLDRKNKIATSELENRPPSEEELSLGYIRSGNIPGTHSITYRSEIDSITIAHCAHNRRGFALGALVAATFVLDKKGIFDFSEVF